MEATPTPPETSVDAPAPEPRPEGDEHGHEPTAVSSAPANPYPGWVYPSTRRRDPEKVFHPGPVFYLVSVVVVGLGLYENSLPGEASLGYVWLAGAVLAFVWFVAFVIAASDSRLLIRRRTWANWAGIPALGVLFVALVSSNLPVDARFRVSQNQIESAAEATIDGNVPAAGWIGLIPVTRITTYPDGLVVFEVEGATTCGFARTPSVWQTTDWSSSTEGYSVHHVTGNWWTWCQSFPSD